MHAIEFNNVLYFNRSKINRGSRVKQVLQLETRWVLLSCQRQKMYVLGHKLKVYQNINEIYCIVYVYKCIIQYTVCI